MKQKVLVLLANGFEDIEAIAVIDLLRRGNVVVDLVSMEGTTVQSSSGITLQIDKQVADVDPSNYAMLFLPGGKGVKRLDGNEYVTNIITWFHLEKRWIAAICAAPMILGKLGLLDERSFTCYPGFEEFGTSGTYLKTGVVQDGHIITGRGVGYVFDFARHLLDVLVGSNESIHVAKQTLLLE